MYCSPLNILVIKGAKANRPQASPQLICPLHIGEGKYWIKDRPFLVMKDLTSAVKAGI